MFHLTFNFSIIRGKVLFGMKSVRGFPIFLAATAIAMPALPPLLPTNSLAPLLTASWDVESYR